MTLRLSRTDAGTLIHSPRRYDLWLWARALGRERSFRRQLVALARVSPGDHVLDVGCGTGTLAVAAKRRAGATGTVAAVDPSHEMVARARAKARRSGLEIGFDSAVAQDLPYPDATFDVVLNTLVLHQLPHGGIHAAAEEMTRVLKPGGRLLVADIDVGDPANPRRTPHAHSRRAARSHGGFDGKLIVPLLRGGGLEIVESGPLPFRLRRFERLLYVLARKPEHGKEH